MAGKRMVIVDGHTAFRQLLCKAFAKDRAVQVVGDTASLDDARSLCKERAAEMVLLDPGVGDRLAIGSLRRLLRELPQICALLHTASIAPGEIAGILGLRPHGVVHKSSPLAELREGVRAVAHGRIFYCSTAANLLRPHFDPHVPGGDGHDNRTASGSNTVHPNGNSNGVAGTRTHSANGITQRESEVLQLIVDGHSSKQIAAVLGLSIRTVESHRMSIMSKVDVHDVVSLTRRALSDGLVQPNGFQPAVTPHNIPADGQ